ncbi:prepilin peptidase [Dehalobacter sp. DCM]|uniref:prepilin peptidase n=1 Tax=Dehalobacter sp. DCM TaxID=2907827 RepID=UPI0030819536|nr:prepilin peptidase [Dehalobacter sp. DCM]
MNAFIILISGILAGLLMEKITVLLVKRRVKEIETPKFTGTPLRSMVWALLNGLSWLAVYLLDGLSARAIECALVISVVIIISAIDISIKKIPNELLLSLLIIHTGVLIAEGQINSILPAIFGLATGFFVFMLPFLVGKSAGFGDLKFSAVVGYILGVHGVLLSVIIMVALLILFTLYLIATRKGGLKTRLALGPFMAAGALAVMIYNLALGQNLFSFITLFTL